MTCQRCGSYAQGDLCRQCEIEQRYEHLANETASDSRWDHDEEGSDE